MMKLGKWMASSLRTKLIAMFVLLTILPLIGVGVISYQKSYTTVSEHSIASTQVTTDQLQRDIDILFQDTKKFLEIGKNNSVLHFLLTQSETYEDAKDILKMFQVYRETYKFSDSIINISIVNMYGKGISEKKGVFQAESIMMKNPHFLSLLNNPDETLIIPPVSSSIYDRLDQTEVKGHQLISLAAVIEQRVTHEVIGFIMIDLDASVVESFLNHTKIGETGYLYVTDDKGHPIFLPQHVTDPKMYATIPVMQQQKGSFIDRSTSPERFIVFSTSQLTGWKIIGDAPLKEVMRDANEIKYLILISVGFSILCTIALYYFITSQVIRPIQYLKHKMRQAASGNLEAKVKNNRSEDEISDLGSSFNSMLEQIRMLLAHSIREQEEIKKAELRTLQAQINPHFLYNTLDSIVWMAEAKKSEQVIDLVKALSHFFRITLSKGKDWIMLKDEIEHVRNYLTIQKMRYSDILDFELYIDEAIFTYRILKLTLQPIVENALYHGIKNKRRKGLITITGGFSPEGHILLEVIDNGIGMTPEQVLHLRSILEQDVQADSGFGIKNVHKRIRLYYGEPYGVAIESEYGHGTQITITIPKEGIEDEKSVSGR
ncbi:sensor histidine kinase [Paenibacillus hexagrammi]|uniref:histidine kinase n=1 Tax=Paenibacillus hexagrammi TaxID=2908839 RepID=A0ABY3SEZ3_9BACL|nr:sensor histidine kinase [Paenibacillus sp. YPD9-1]UJF32564.1 sensor histidine kinase [Paenibacillus sp. YPD9-1]